ncbi:MAG: 4Fe-4S dicluster domain-containing protein [Thermodesulfobacteriota bacterium]
MKIVYVELDRCIACHNCERACLFHKAEQRAGSTANIFVSVDMEQRRIFAGTCRQCDAALCMDVCPVNALTRDPLTSAVVVDKQTCISCGMCIIACPYGYMSLDGSSHMATKCDLCGGDPRCVQMCMADALHFDSIQSLAKQRKQNPDMQVGLRAVSDKGDVAP